MKNAQYGHPFVSFDPTVEEQIEKYLANRPDTNHDFLFASKKGEKITASVANYVCNLLWLTFRKTGNDRLPIRFRFNNQRYALATTMRHEPVDGQPPIEVTNGLMVSIDYSFAFHIYFFHLGALEQNID